MPCGFVVQIAEMATVLRADIVQRGTQSPAEEREKREGQREAETVERRGESEEKKLSHSDILGMAIAELKHKLPVRRCALSFSSCAEVSCLRL